MMESNQSRRLRCQANIGDILLVGEQLRVRMHTDNPHLIKDRRHHFRSQTCCFVGTETVDWLVESGQAPDRETATCLMTILLDNDIIHQIPEEQTFRDDNSFYRFRKDDSTFPWHEAVTLFQKGQRLFTRLLADGELVMRVQEDNAQLHANAFKGNELLDWLLANGDFEARSDAIAECRRMLENDVLRHVTDSHHFKDEPLLYQFKTDYSKKPQLLDLIGQLPLSQFTSPIRSVPRHPRGSMSNGRKQSPSAITSKSPQHLLKGLDIPHERRPHRTESGYHSYPEDEPNSASPQFGSPNSLTGQQSPSGVTGMLFRKATMEELEAPGSPYIKKHIRIASDPVGFGFVIRGEGPSYVKTVDPTGPAAQAGLKVGQYVIRVNDMRVVDMDHRSLANVILAHMGYLRLVVMEHGRDK